MQASTTYAERTQRDSYWPTSTSRLHRRCLGHSDPRLTIGLYAQVTSAADKSAAEALGAHFSTTPRDGRGIAESAT